MLWRVTDLDMFTENIQGYNLTTATTGLNKDKYHYYNPEKYDLVEKPDYKLNKLKYSLECSSRQKNNNYILLKQVEEKKKEFIKNIEQCNKDIEELEQELKELEK